MAASIFSSVLLMVPPCIGGLLQQDGGHWKWELLISCSHNSSSLCLLLVSVYITAGFRITKHLRPSPCKSLRYTTDMCGWVGGGVQKVSGYIIGFFLALSAKIWLLFLSFIANAAKVGAVLHSDAACVVATAKAKALPDHQTTQNPLPPTASPQKRAAVGEKCKLYIELQFKKLQFAYAGHKLSLSGDKAGTNLWPTCYVTAKNMEENTDEE